MGYRRLNLSRVGRAILIGISLSLLMNRNTWSQEAIAPNIQPYIDQLRDDIEENNLEASRRVKEEIGIDDMMQALERDNQELRFAILEALGKIELGGKRREVIAVLINLLKTDTDEEVRNYVTYSLADMGILAKDAIDALIEAAQTDSSQKVRVGSIRALKTIAPYQLKTIQTYIDVQQDPNQYVRNLAVDYLSDILRNIDSDVLDQALEKVKAALKQDNDWQTRLAAAEALGRSGRDVQSAVSTLEKALKSNNEKLTPNVINALEKIAENFLLHVVSLTREELVNAQTREELVNAKKGLEKAIEILDDLGNPGENIEEIENNLGNALTQINDLLPPIPKITEIFEKYPLRMGGIIIVILWFPLIFILFWIRPLWLLKIDQFLQSYTDIPLPNVLGGIKISTLRGLLFNLHYHPKVLDTWVKSKLETARHEFKKKKRNIYISIPVYLNDKIVIDFRGENLKSPFNEQRECLLIWGEGGLGKTSLACQLADWAMSDDPKEKMCGHQMLPILLEEELDFQVGEGKEMFIKAIQGKLRDLLDGEETSRELLVQLLTKKRLLVIVDGLSEKSENIRRQIQPAQPGFSVNALVITSRIKEELGVNITRLQPSKFKKDQLLDFTTSYLRARNKSYILKDKDTEDIKKGIEKLFKMDLEDSPEEITVLLVKLYIDLIINTQDDTDKADKNLDSLPRDVPDLMLKYLNSLTNKNDFLENKNKEQLYWKVQKNTFLIAWECLKNSYQPKTAKRNDVLDLLKKEQAEAYLAEEYLEYLEGDLQIIKRGPLENQIHFSLDPLAEYMAALYVVESHGENRQKWDEFLDKADELGKKSIIQGFLRAVQDCCLAKQEDKKAEFMIPEFVLEKLNEMVSSEL
ncbi:HEAT repeat domain-containing protein [Trichodesmium erythraeum 21-75]|nr:HEAT repeat domain-containing protein [Trichodesmium erythraeum 21-75]